MSLHKALLLWWTEQRGEVLELTSRRHLRKGARLTCAGCLLPTPRRPHPTDGNAPSLASGHAGWPQMTGVQRREAEFSPTRMGTVKTTVDDRAGKEPESKRP